MRIKAPQGAALARVQAVSPGFRASLVQPSAALRPFPSLQGWAIPLSLTLATPDLAGRAGVAGRNPKFHFRKEKLL